MLLNIFTFDRSLRILKQKNRFHTLCKKYLIFDLKFNKTIFEYFYL